MMMAGLNEEQHAIVIGSLLGDGAMRCKRSALLEINHCFEQRSYVDWKYRALQEFVMTPPKARVTNGDRQAYRFVTRSLPALTPYYDLFYAGAKKTIPELTLTPLALATWFMDDGCKSRRTVYLNTQQFDIASQLRAMEALKRSFGITSTLNRDKHYFRIRIAAASIGIFCDLVRPYIIPEMQYKLPA